MIGVKSTLLKRIDAINATIEHCKKTNNQECIGKMLVLRSQTEANLREYEAFMVKLGPFRNYVESNLLGVFPAFIVTGAAALATSLYLFFEKIKNEGKAFELIQKGYLKPSEARAILSGGGISETLGNVSQIAMIGLAAYALFLFGPMLTKKG